HPSSYREGPSASLLLMALGSSPGQHDDQPISFQLRLNWAARFVNLDSPRRTGLRWRNAVRREGRARSMTCATDIVAAVVAAGLFGARTMHSMCTSLTATGVVLEADVSGFADPKAHYFVNDTRCSSTPWSPER